MDRDNPQIESAVAGRVIGIARRPARRMPMETLAAVAVSVVAGIDGDCKGLKFRKRQVTVLAAEDWARACAEIGAQGLDWTVRRANVLVTGMALPRARGAILRLGLVRLEVTGQTYPCVRMEEARRGLLKALAADWRGGLTCRVLEGGLLQLREDVEILSSPQPELPLPLPG